MTGTGPAGTGGTIQNTTGDGILLTSASNVSLSSMNIQNANEDGIFGTTVTGLDLNGCSITNNGDDSEDVGIRVNNLSGSAAWTNLTVTGSELANVIVNNTTGTLSTFNISGGNYSNLGAAFGGNSILVSLFGDAVLTSGLINGTTIANNGLARGLTVQAQFTGGLNSRIGDLPPGTTNAFTVQNSTFQNNGLHVSFEQSGAAHLAFKMLNNLNMTGAAPSHAINVASSATSTGGTLRGRIQGNTIGNAAVPNSGSTTGNGIRGLIQGQTQATLLIDGNTIRQTGAARGIDAQFLGTVCLPFPGCTGAAAPASDITITNNNIDHRCTAGEPPCSAGSNSPLAAIYVAADSQTNGAVTVRSDVRLNTVPAVASSEGTFIIVDEVVAAAQAQLVDTAPASATCTDQLTSTNTGSASGASGCALIAGPINTPP